MSSPHPISGLDAVHVDVLAVLGLSKAREVSRSYWQEDVRAAGATDAKGRSLHGGPFKAIVERLRDVGAVNCRTPSTYSIDEAWMPAALDGAARRGRLRTFADGVASLREWSFRREGRLAYPIELRVALAEGDQAAIRRAIETPRPSWEQATLLGALGLRAPRTWIDGLPTPHRDEYLRQACHVAFTRAFRLGEDALDAAAHASEPEMLARAATIVALSGDAGAAEEILARSPSADVWVSGARAFVALTTGRWDAARRTFDETGARRAGVRGAAPSYLAVFDLLLTCVSPEGDIAELHARQQKANRAFAEWPVAREALDALLAFRTSGRVDSDRSSAPATAWIEHLLVALVDRWTGAKKVTREPLAPLRQHASAAGYRWLVEQMDELLGGTGDERSLARLYAPRAKWEMALDALESFAKPAPSPQASTATGSIYWTLEPTPWAGLRVEARLVGPRGGAGKALSLSKLGSDAGVALDDRDRRLVTTLLAARNSWSKEVPLKHLEWFVGHPRLRDGSGNAITVARREPRVVVTKTNAGARIALVPSRFDDSGVAVKQSGAELLVSTRTPLVARVLDVLGEEGLLVPAKGSARMGQVLSTLSAEIPVEADGAAGFWEGETSGDPRVRVQLFRAGAGLRARLRVTPGGEGTKPLRPGAPPVEVLVPCEAGVRRVRRDLAREEAGANALLEQCPTLASLPLDGDDYVASEMATCLELLLELGASGACLEWPEGKALRVPTLHRGADVRVRVGGTSTWLDIEGEVKLDETRVVTMRELLASASRAHGRFVPIGEDEFVALTEDVRAKLDALARAQELATRGRLSATLLPAVEGWLDGLDVTWSEELERRREAIAAAERSVPRVPRALAAELRDYQKEGFVFLAKRTEAGLGACLADDMGLGKTVQGLALLLHRARRGPALVVAPTSVCRNWVDEALRFAPTLRVERLEGGDRAALVAGAEAGDVIVTSYALLVAEEEALAAKSWATVIFDEAHALKNASTRRWAAARAVDAAARVAMTGTPVENHIGELHAVFDVVAPGMMGPRAAFERAFGAPIASGQRDAISALRQIVRPLVLRRTKAEVLSELPPKTEVTRVVEPTADHVAFYEAVRRRALERLEAAKKEGRGGQARIEILAEITRLRRAAIDPRLVGGSDAPAGAKLEAFAHLVRELRDEGRRVLVFSQFLEVLDFARERLDEMGASHVRLDGSMSAQARAEAVSAFQAGQIDVFLLSLKAGGVGMNLTAADAVVHMDPWWNPAVEDQATDRAHRIGQTRPVTIVRLVTAGTIEEKVLALHGKKRQMYEDVVGEADGGGPLDVDALTALVTGDGAVPPKGGRTKGPSVLSGSTA